MQEPDHASLSCTRGSKVLCGDRSQEPWVKEPCILGIDEAGRGPVLGPMVYACVYAPASLDMKGRAFADSKTLTAEKRDALFTEIFKDCQLGWVAEILSASLISTSMQSRERVSLNALATTSTFKIIQAVLDKGVRLTEVYIDTVGDADRYKSQLERRFPSLSFTVCPKADALFPVVSAASIVAKVTRDRALEACQQDAGVGYDVKLGSGYPADPDTKAWLLGAKHKVFGFTAAPLIRFSWETCARLMAEECVNIQFEADAEEGITAGSGKQQRLSFAPANQAALVETNALGRHAFFRARKLQRLGDVF